MTRLEGWIGAPVSEFTTGEDVAAAKAIAALPRGAPPSLADRAVARLLTTRRHLLWRAARRYKAHLQAALERVVSSAEGPEPALLRRLPRDAWDEPLDVLRAIWVARNNHDLVSQLRKVPGERSESLRVAVQAVVDDQAFARGLGVETEFETADQGHMGLVAVAMLVGCGLPGLLAREVLVARKVAGLYAMAKQAGPPAATVRRALEETLVRSAAARESASWAARVGVEVPACDEWRIGVTVRPVGADAAVAYAVVELYGNHPADWCVTVHVDGRGATTWFAATFRATPLCDDLRLDALTSILDVGRWLVACERRFPWRWDLDAAQTGGTADAAGALRRWMQAAVADARSG